MKEIEKVREKRKIIREEKIEKETNRQVRKETKRPSSTHQATKLVCQSESFRISD